MAVKTASVLAFERKLANSDALLHAGAWENRDCGKDWQPVSIQEKSVRGTMSNRLKAALQQNPAKLDAEIQKPNLQTVDAAALPAAADTLRVSFTLRVLGNLSQPSACNDQDYQNALAAVIDSYAQEQGFRKLAARYAANLANGRFLWRNRVGAEAVAVRVRQMQDGQAAQEWNFDGLSVALRQFAEPTAELKSLAEVIAAGLLGRSFVLLEVDGFVRLGKGQEVFPSQELILDKSGKKSKTLYQVGGTAAMHSQKIGNALRTIDTWHSSAAEIGPIAVEPYGSVTNRGKAYRQPKEKEDFYSLLDGWAVKGKVPPAEQQHYVMAVLIRGGVFGEKGE
ncbi:CRISPR-associated protein Csy3 [Candidatus Electronema halotolerans]